MRFYLDFFHQKLSILHPNGGACDAAHTILRCKHLNNQAPILRDNGGESIRCQIFPGKFWQKGGKVFRLKILISILGNCPSNNRRFKVNHGESKKFLNQIGYLKMWPKRIELSQICPKGHGLKNSERNSCTNWFDTYHLEYRIHWFIIQLPYQTCSLGYGLLVSYLFRMNIPLGKCNIQIARVVLFNKSHSQFTTYLLAVGHLLSPGSTVSSCMLSWKNRSKVAFNIYTTPKTNMGPQKRVLKMIFLFKGVGDAS